MARAFSPGLSSGAPPAGDALLFVCRESEVLVAETEAGAEIPRVASLGGLGELHYLGALGDVGCWAAGLDSDEKPPAGYALRGLRGLHGVLEDDVWSIAGRAAQIVAWARDHRFCGRCGTPTELARAERARRCPACGLLAFPRVSPAVITLVRRGREALLAHGRRFANPVYSALAGFVDPGESLEEAVVREVREEAGIEVTDVGYFGSQPWPFPHQLMVAFTARWAGGEIAIDETELVDARWFSPEALPELPARLSIARRLVDAWLAETPEEHRP
jgi:NAD+ diphosphatase